MPLCFFQSIQINLTKVQTKEPFAKVYLPLFVCFARSMDHHPILSRAGVGTDEDRCSVETASPTHRRRVNTNQGRETTRVQRADHELSLHGVAPLCVDLLTAVIIFIRGEVDLSRDPPVRWSPLTTSTTSGTRNTTRLAFIASECTHPLPRVSSLIIRVDRQVNK